MLEKITTGRAETVREKKNIKAQLRTKEYRALKIHVLRPSSRPDGSGTCLDY